VGAVTLRNYKLMFCGNRRGCGVANIHRRNGCEVVGLLWEITPQCEKNLDWYEGYPHLYEKKTVTVYDADGTATRAMVYVMTAEHRNPAMPTKHYYRGIADGFDANGIPRRNLRAALSETANLAIRQWRNAL
jgi:gamma-glutamylcyclotransferase (GGCT)/AIG2-like uncharacterized protein YtfP